MTRSGSDGDADASRGSFRDLAAAVIALARENDIGIVASGVAFYLFNSLVPLLLFLFIGLSATDRLGPAVELVGAVAGIDVRAFLGLLDSIVGDDADRRRAAVIAGLILLWSSLRLVQAINVSFQTIHNVRHEHSLLGTVLDSLLVFATIILVVPAVSLLAVALTVLTDVSALRLISAPLLCVVLFGGFLPMYSRFSDPETTLPQAFPGAALAAVAWALCAVGLRLYVSTSESVRLYGVAGGVLLLLTWLYVGGLTLLIGAVLNAVLTDSVDVDADERPDE
ncbi:YihY/virulence factor BrkB family protein [Halorubrum lipolyticum]|uniref:Ribonuclease BN n=1 Tax=Halorubrum lipolyticum DSM 21995 TaxID=1227482 RepID=M0NPY2_9EURY|nr:YihY/virulence factor BrkB family protein [Halorubrum lipolyticum]EMA59254.1 ribonuclease BN [Halorubrum lipolyticum DSM 21995]